MREQQAVYLQGKPHQSAKGNLQKNKKGHTIQN